MPNIDYLIEIMEEQRIKAAALKDIPEIVEMALDIAYYSAMIDAATDDPLEDDREQADVMHHLTFRLKECLERYETLVNDNI